MNAIEKYPPEVRQMLAETTRCLNCGVPLKYQRKHIRRRNGGYCSMSCYYAKPPKMAWLERTEGKPIRDILLDKLNSGAPVEVVAQLLGVGKYTLYQWIHKCRIRRVVRYE